MKCGKNVRSRLNRVGMTALLPLSVSAAALVPACAREDLGMRHRVDQGIDLRDTPDPIALRLRQMKSCDELEETLRSSIEREAAFASSARADRSGNVDLGMPSLAQPEGVAAPMAAEDDGANITNNQTDGVDEGDLIKSDGTHLYIATGDQLTIAKAVPAPELARVATLKLVGTTRELFVVGGRVIVFADVWEPREGEPYDSGHAVAGSDATPDIAIAPYDPGYRGYGRQMTAVSVIDVSEPAEPALIRSYKTEGSYLTSRRVGNRVYAVLQGRIHKFHGVEPSALPASAELLRQALPGAADSVQGELPFSGACTDYYVDDLSPGAALSDIFSVDVAAVTADEATPMGQHTLVMGQGAVVYASTESLYLATNAHFGWWSRWAWDAAASARTSVHKFSIASAEHAARYLASGSLPGRILNQFSMDEYEGNLRIAMTTEGTGFGVRPMPAEAGGEPVTSPPVAIDADSGASRDDDSTVSSSSSLDGPVFDEGSNDLWILGEQGSALVSLGSVRGLAPGERIFSARFAGSRGFIVTFRQVDPLFTFDLSDPERPRLLGELKIPGFSNYIHFIGEDHLLTIGNDADEQTGITTGMQLSLFDVSDMTRPVRTHIFDLGQGYSEANYDHRAFAFFEAEAMLAIPVQAWGSWGESQASGLRVFDVSVETGFSARALITHSGADPTYPAAMRRAFLMDGHLFALSDRRLTASPLAGLTDAPVASLSLPRSDTFDGDVIILPFF